MRRGLTQNVKRHSGCGVLFLFAAFAKDNFHVAAPVFMQPEDSPFDFGFEVAKDLFGCGVDAKGRGYEVKAWGFGRKADTGKIAVALEVAETAVGAAVSGIVRGTLCADVVAVGESVAGVRIGGLGVVPADANPVVEALESEVEIFRGFEFEDGEASVAGDGEEVEHAAVACLEGWDLGVNVGGVELA